MHCVVTPDTMYVWYYSPSDLWWAAWLMSWTGRPPTSGSLRWKNCWPGCWGASAWCRARPVLAPWSQEQTPQEHQNRPLQRCVDLQTITHTHCCKTYCQLAIIIIIFRTSFEFSDTQNICWIVFFKSVLFLYLYILKQNWYSAVHQLAANWVCV